MFQVFKAVLAEPPLHRVPEAGREDRASVLEHARVEHVPLVAHDLVLVLQHARQQEGLLVPGRRAQGAAVVDHAVVGRHLAAAEVRSGQVAEPRAASCRQQAQDDGQGKDVRVRKRNVEYYSFM